MSTIQEILPNYTPPDFSRLGLAHSPAARTEPAPADGVLPRMFHATSNHPEYVNLGNGEWVLAPESRMDSVLVLRGKEIDVVEPVDLATRRIQADELLAGDPIGGEEQSRIPPS